MQCASSGGSYIQVNGHIQNHFPLQNTAFGLSLFATISLTADKNDKQVAGTYPAYIGKNSGTDKKIPTFLSITPSQSYESESSATPVNNLGDYSGPANSISVEIPVVITSCLTSKVEVGAASGMRKPCSNTSTSVAVTQGSTLFSRHRIFYSTKRENKHGLPTKHVLVVQESATSNTRFFKEIFGSTYEIETIFDRTALASFLEHIRKNFRKCEILRCLSRKCPIKASKTVEKRQFMNANKIENDVTMNDIPKDDTELGEDSNTQSNSILDKLVVDENCNISYITMTQRQNREKKRDKEVEALSGQAILNKKTSDNVGIIDRKIPHKKTKRGCRGGGKTHNPNSTYYRYQCSKRKKEMLQGSDPVHLTEDPTLQFEEKIVTFAEEISGTKNGNYANVVEITEKKEVEKTEEEAAQKETISKNKRSPSPRFIGTVSDRLLARMQRNILQDITFPRKVDRYVTDLSKDETSEQSIFFGGYISQEEGVRRSHRLRQTDTPQSHYEKRKKSSKKRKEKHADRKIKHVLIGSEDSVIVKRIRFRYNTDIVDSDGEDSDHTTSRLSYSEFLGLNSPKIGNPQIPLTSDTEGHVRSDSEGFVRSDSDINCTDATESLSSAQWLEAMTVTSSKAMKSGLSHHVNFRTFRTEVEVPTLMITYIRAQYWTVNYWALCRIHNIILKISTP